MVKNYSDFLNQLNSAGFSMGGGNAEGIFAVVPFGWNNEPEGSPVHWHTGEPETDPWEWRMRVLDEDSNIAYSKCFFKKSGYITRAWYPAFLAVRRGGQSFEDAYSDGKISYEAKRIYTVIQKYGTLPLHGIKELGEFSREEKSRFDRALIELQMGLFITMCGRRQKLSKKGEEYGWFSTVFCTTETFWGPEVFALADRLSSGEATEAIRSQVLALNPEAKESKIKKFITG